ncbi:MAG TPA: tRNA (N6-isopentenyl adenosine(37)-C2)-methylthiotransferase MiaB [Dissulfurispiraceae bacterium]|nr:tRNA (N6-isopentenyl adenosine(37)-C2)-methylthiotransferase MiaB [Dissulfurispiraceae bacterium]
MKKRTYYLETFGCQMNVHDSEKMAGILEHEGYTRTSEPKHADLILFNTCSIREKAEQKFYSRLGRIKTIKTGNPFAKIAVAGCIAQQDGKKLTARAPYVDFVFGPDNLAYVKEIAAEVAQQQYVLSENPALTNEFLPSVRENSVKAWVNIMYGCNNFCSYCVVPYTRGRERSRPSADVLIELRDLAEKGYKEVTLLGQNVNSYRSDCDFPELLRRANDLEGIERIRFVTSHPKDLSSALMYAIRNLNKVCEHIHLPLQSGSTRILQLMNRRYTYDEYRAKVDALRENIPDIAITSDIIAGFPQETDDDHEATLEAIKSIGFDGLFAFKYSSRPGTKAEAISGHLEDAVKSKRLDEIITLQNSVIDKKNKQLEGTVQTILADRADPKMKPDQAAGRTATNKIVLVSNAASVPPGTILSVRIVRAHRHSLVGECISS